MLKIKNQLLGIGGLVVGVVAHHYGGKLLEYKSELAASKEQELRDIADKENMSTIHSKLTTLTEGQDKLIDKLDTLIKKN